MFVKQLLEWNTLLTIVCNVVQTQGRNIRTYADYLTQRAVSYGQTQVDYVRAGEGRFKTLNVEKGLLRETENVQEQIRALIRCDVGVFRNIKPCRADRC